MATTRRSFSVYPPLIFAYLSFQAAHSLTYLTHHIAAQNPSQTTRTTLQLLSTLALGLAVHSTRRSAERTPRYPIVSAFVTSLATVIASTVRLLFLFQQRTPPNLTSILPPLAASLLILVILRFSPPLRALRSSSPTLLKHLIPPLISRKRRTPVDEAVAGPALLAVLLHAALDIFGRALELFAYLTSGTVVSARVADALAALVSIMTAYPLLQLCTRVLVHAAPGRIASLAKARCEVLAREDGVIRCANLHVWEESVGFFVGTVSVIVGRTVDKSAVLDKAVEIFDDVLQDLTIQVETAQGEEGE